MPRVSQEHLDARREQILSAAERCFSRDGFHATSMQDIFAEADMSAGAVYRYFASKTEIVRAIVGRVLDAVLRDFAAAAESNDPRPLDEILGGIITARLQEPSVERLRTIILQVWAEMGRNPEVRAVGQEIMGKIRNALARLVRRAQERGELPAGTDPAAAAQFVLAVFQGHIVQMTIIGPGVLANLPEAVQVAIAGLNIRPLTEATSHWHMTPVPAGPANG